MIWHEDFILLHLTTLSVEWVILFFSFLIWGRGEKKHMQSFHILVDTNLAISKIVQRSHSHDWIKGEEKQWGY
jgi:hypothetical protein